MSGRKTVLIGFDGTLNSYKTGFIPNKPDMLPDPPTPGAIAFLKRTAHSPRFNPVIFTARVLEMSDAMPGGGSYQDNPMVVRAIREWLVEHGLEPVLAQSIRITAAKLPNSLIIDDNGFRYEGSWPTPAEMDELTAPKKGSDRA